MDHTDSDTARATGSKSQTSVDANEVNAINRRYLQFNFLVYVETSEKRSQQENHLNRLQNIRKELKYIKESEWQYAPIEKFIGQS